MDENRDRELGKCRGPRGDPHNLERAMRQAAEIFNRDTASIRRLVLTCAGCGADVTADKALYRDGLGALCPDCFVGLAGPAGDR